jgi:hypothetical protein
MKKARQNTASDSVRMPASRGARVGIARFLHAAEARIKVTTLSATWMRKTHSQLDKATIAPPMIGPKPSPMPKMMPHQPNAVRARALPELMG